MQAVIVEFIKKLTVQISAVISVFHANDYWKIALVERSTSPIEPIRIGVCGIELLKHFGQPFVYGREVVNARFRVVCNCGLKFIAMVDICYPCSRDYEFG